MKKIVVAFFILFLFVPNYVFALSISARNAVVMEVESGRILYEKKKDDSYLIASITKIMTAILAIEYGNLDDKVVVGDEVLEMYGSNIYVEVGEELTLRDLVYGLILRSGNDASVVIAKHISGSIDEFVILMNEKAKEIGMTNTVFNNPHGLDEVTENKSSAYDMAKLSSYAYKNEEFRKISGCKKYSVQSNMKSYIWYNRNKLLTSYKYTTGGKTGYTPRAGKTLVTTASKDGMDLTVVTLNDGNEYQTHENLYEYYFDNYKMYKILDKSNFDVDDGFYKGKVYIKNDFSYPLTEQEVDKVKVLIKLNNKSLNDGVVGEVIVTLNEDVIYEDYVYVKEEKKQEGLFRKIWNSIFKF